MYFKWRLKISIAMRLVSANVEIHICRTPYLNELDGIAEPLSHPLNSLVFMTRYYSICQDLLCQRETREQFCLGMHLNSPPPPGVGDSLRNMNYSKTFSSKTVSLRQSWRQNYSILLRKLYREQNCYYWKISSCYPFSSLEAYCLR